MPYKILFSTKKTEYLLKFSKLSYLTMFSHITSNLTTIFERSGPELESFYTGGTSFFKIFACCYPGLPEFTDLSSNLISYPFFVDTLISRLSHFQN